MLIMFWHVKYLDDINSEYYKLKSKPLYIFCGVIALILMTIMVAIGGILLAATLIPGDNSKEGKWGLILLFPMFWLWKRFFIWCGIKFE